MTLAAELLYYTPLQSYFVADQRRLRYIGDKGSAMLVDINYVKHLDLSRTFRLSIDPQNLDWKVSKYHPSLEKEAIGLISDFCNCRYRCFGNSLAPRENLGSAYGENKVLGSPADHTLSGLSPQPGSGNKETLSKAQVLDLLSSGFTPAEIAQCYTGFTKMQLAAFKAHQTMGTYRRREEHG